MRLYKLIILNRKLNFKWKQEGLYQSLLLKKFINNFIFRGNINKIEKLMYKSFLLFKHTHRLLPEDIISSAIEDSRLNVYLKVYKKRSDKFLIIPRRLSYAQSFRIANRYLFLYIFTLPVENHLFKYYPKIIQQLFNFLVLYKSGVLNVTHYRATIYKLALRYNYLFHFRW